MDVNSRGQNPASDLESLHLDFCKKSLVFCFELGHKPLQLNRKCRRLKYWLKSKNYEKCILSNIYQYMF